MRERRREETEFSGWERRRFSIRRRDDDRTEGLPIEIALSRVSAARFRGLIRVVWSREGGSFWWRMEKRPRRSSACERASETKVAVWCRIWDEVAPEEVVMVPPWWMVYEMGFWGGFRRN